MQTSLGLPELAGGSKGGEAERQDDERTSKRESSAQSMPHLFPLLNLGRWMKIERLTGTRGGR